MHSSPSYTILIVGLGAIGTVFATVLKNAGHRVFALTREKQLADFRQRKLQVTGIWGEHEAQLDGLYDSTAPLQPVAFDFIFLTVKSYDTESVIRQLKPLIRDSTVVITAQNGYGNYEVVSETIGREHTLLAGVYFGAKLSSPGLAEVTVIADKVQIGQPHNAVPQERVNGIAAAISAAGIPAVHATDVYAAHWDKIIYNSALNPLGAILECNYGKLAAHPETRWIMDQIIDEIFQVARAHGIVLRWSSPQAYCEHFYSRLLPPTIQHFPSMYYDVQAGKRLEIDALNGAIVKLAHEKAIKVPVNETITGLIKIKETMTRRES